MTTETELRRGYGLEDGPDTGDLLIEIDDREDAETIHVALTDYAAKQWQAVRRYAANPALADYYKQLAHKADALDRRFEELLFPEPQPDDLIEVEPPLPKDEGRLALIR